MDTDATIEDTARLVLEAYEAEPFARGFYAGLAYVDLTRDAAPELAREVLRLSERVTFLEGALDHNVPNWRTRTLILGGTLAVMDDERTESPVSDAR